MDKFQVVLTPESYKLWVIRPEILFIADQVIMDKKDYNEIKRKECRSSLDKRISILLEAITNEGLVELKEYPDFLSLSERKEIHNLAKTIINELTSEEILKLHKHAYKEYSSYLKAKLLYLRPKEDLFHYTVKELHETESIGRINALQDEDLEQHIRFILTRIVAKWVAGEIICKKLGLSALHDTDEYRPFAKIIRKKFTSNDEIIASLFLTDYTIPLQLLLETMRLCFNTPELKTLDDITQFKLSRIEFQIIRNVFRDILNFYRELREYSIIQQNLERRIRESKAFVEAQIKKLPTRLAIVVLAVVDFIFSLFGISAPVKSTVSKPLKSFAEKRAAKSIIQRYADPFIQLCCFSVYAERNIPTLPESQSDKEFGKIGRSWILDPHLPWYESEVETK